MPLLALLLPRRRLTARARRALGTNQQRLVSHFDLWVALQDLLVPDLRARLPALHHAAQGPLFAPLSFHGAAGPASLHYTPPTCARCGGAARLKKDK